MSWTEAVALLDTISGVDERVAEVMLAEMGLVPFNFFQVLTPYHVSSGDFVVQRLSLLRPQDISAGRRIPIPASNRR